MTLSIEMVGFDEVIAQCKARTDRQPESLPELQAIFDASETVQINIEGSRAIASPSHRLMAFARG